MTFRQLHDLLADVADTEEVVVGSEQTDGLLGAWLAAHDEEVRALAAWRRRPGREAYVAYRAACDRSDAAQDALAASR
jgi:hypothetical protein